MHLQGIEKVTLTALDLESARQFYLDWGLSLKEEDANALLFESLNGAQVGVPAQMYNCPRALRKIPRSERSLGASVTLRLWITSGPNFQVFQALRIMLR